jgi:long-chain acyl-CoA synthetase
VLISTAFVAGRATGNILERDNGGDAGWVNSYEQSKYEAERNVRASGLPWTIVRPSTIVCRGPSGDIPQINAVHRALRVYHRGLAAMMPGDRAYLLDVITSSYVADAIASLTFDQRALHQTVHLCAGRGALTLGELVDTAYEVWAENPDWRKRGVERVIITDAATYALFESAVMETGDVRLRAVLSSLAHFIPHLALPKVFSPLSLLDAPPPAPGTCGCVLSLCSPTTGQTGRQRRKPAPSLFFECRLAQRGSSAPGVMSTPEALFSTGCSAPQGSRADRFH